MSGNILKYRYNSTGKKHKPSWFIKMHNTLEKKKFYIECVICKKSFYIPRCRKETAKYCSRNCHKAFQNSIKYRELYSGKNSPIWKGGRDRHPDKVIRKSIEYKTWRSHVFNRDDYTCQSCGIRGGKLHADHELSFAEFPELRFEILNGRTLCIQCHKKTLTWGKRPSMTLFYRWFPLKT